MKKKCITFVVSREEKLEGFFYYTFTCRESPLLSVSNVLENRFFETMELLTFDFNVNLGLRVQFEILH